MVAKKSNFDITIIGSKFPLKWYATRIFVKFIKIQNGGLIELKEIQKMLFQINDKKLFEIQDGGL